MEESEGAKGITCEEASDLPGKPPGKESKLHKGDKSVGRSDVHIQTRFNMSGSQDSHIDEGMEILSDHTSVARGEHMSAAVLSKGENLPWLFLYGHEVDWVAT